MSFQGDYRCQPMLLLRNVGRHSGRTMINGVGYCQFGPGIGIAASKRAMDGYRQWF